MPDFNTKEKRFEEDIETYLCTEGGYTKGNPKAFDRRLALDKATFLSFVKASQPKQWERYVKIYGMDSEKQMIDRFCVSFVKGLPTAASNSAPYFGNRKHRSMKRR